MKISDVDRAMLDLKNARDRLSKYQSKLQADEAKLIERARLEKQKGQPKVALQLLRIKKMKTREVEQIDAQLLNVLQMVQTIDSKQNEQQVIDAMKTGKDALAKMHEETSLDHVIDLMDQIEMEQELEKEISSVLMHGAGTLSVQDEAAVEQELVALMGETNLATSEEQRKHSLPDVPTTQPLPVAPASKPSEEEMMATKKSNQPVAMQL